MDLKEKLDKLYQISRSDPDPARREEAFQRWHRLSRTAETGKPPVNLDKGNAADEVQLQPDQKANLASRINAMGPSSETNTAIYQGLGRLANGASMGSTDALLDIGASVAGHPNAFREGREKFNAENPFVSPLLDAAGSFYKGGLGSRAGHVMADELETATRALSPKLKKLIGAASVPVTGAAIGGVQGALTAPEGQRLEGAARGAEGGAALSSGLGLLGKGFGVLANGLRNEDVALLEKYGLKPSMVPGVPVKAEDAGVGESIKNPPLGTHTAGPKTRQAAGLRAGEELTKGISEIEHLNNDHLAQLRARNNIEHGRPPHVRGTPEEFTQVDGEEPTVVIDEPVTNAQQVYGNGTYPRSDVRRPLSLIDALHLRSDLPNATRGRLGEVRSRLEEISDPATQEANPVDVQGVKSLTRHLGNQDRVQGVTASDAALRRVAGAINETLPPEMQAQDRAYAQARKRTEAAKQSLGLRANGTIPVEGGQDTYVEPTEIPEEPGQGEIRLADRSVVKTAGNQLARRSEDTKAGANAEYTTDPLYQNGMPRVMVGAEKPVQISVRSLMDLPALHTAQENLQLNPSALFSGGGLKGVPHRLAGAGARRFLYPPLRAAGEGDPTRPVAPLLTLADALRLRLKQDEQQPDEAVIP